MENENLTLYINQKIANQLNSDKIHFHNNGSKSEFIKKIIVNYHPEYNKEKINLRNKIQESINSEAKSKNIKSIDSSNIAWNITKYLEESSLDKNFKKKIKIHLRINSKDDAFELILNSKPKNASMSGFLENILYSYLEKPLYEREKIIFKETYNELKTAISRKQQVKIKSKSNNSNILKIKKIDPYEICVSEEELFNYVLYKENKEGIETVRSIHLYNIQFVYIQPSNSNFNEEDIIKFNRMKRNGVQFSINDNTIYKIKLTEKGMHFYKNIKYLEKPKALEGSETENDILLFDCSRTQLENYFASFYEEFEILEPESYRNEFKQKVLTMSEKYKIQK